ncbi:MAG: polyprenyl synthetase family protein [Chloroflexi bacterium]|nr:polyprenyl synthetase family protein [Chloroflexota bacterium]
MQPPRSLDLFHGAVRAEMERVLEGKASPLYTMVRYHLGWADASGAATQGEGGGKGLRSTLCLLVAQAVGGDWRQALPAAAALELVHNFSLVHDDVQDGSPERRHRPTVWRLWGEAQAINTGDALFALSHLPLYRLAEQSVPPEKVLHLAQALDHTCLRLCEGQFQDMEFQARLDIGVERYLEMIQGKTAALMALACYAGAYLGSDQTGLAEQLRKAGRHLGLAFQIRDDILGIWGMASAMGKPTAEDVRSRKKSLPVVLAFSLASAEQRRALEDAYVSPTLSEAQILRVLEAFDALGVKGQAQRMAEDYLRRTLDALEATGLRNDALDQLREIARFAIEREY